MKIDLRKLYALKKLEIDETIIIPEEYYQNTDILRLENINVNGDIQINHEEEIELNVIVSGTFILPCAITLEEVPYDFNTEISEIIPENNEKNQFSLELLDILWENIVSEVPIRVVKPDLVAKNIKGDGWEITINVD
ncbi:MAG: DUF177 domain-containing protein [Mollicutes bacterium]|jgi:uncharacterized protein|nr:DUF177 domain-containing protein [Mollicutes bacterium]